MAEECTDSISVATSSSTPPNWWDLSSWNNSNPNSNSSCEEDVSLSTSFHSGLTVESSHRFFEPAASSNELIGEHASDNSLWSHVLLSSVGSNIGEVQNNQDVEEKFVDALSSKSSMSTGMLEPACDYLKKFDNSWEFTNSLNNFDKHISGFSESVLDNERLNKLSNILLSTWSIAPPVSDQLFDPTQACDSTSMNSSLFSCYGLDFKVDNQSRESNEAPAALLVGDNMSRYYGMSNSSSCTRIRSFADIISFSNRIGKPLVDIHAPNHSFKSLNSSVHKKQTSSLTRINGKGQGTPNEGKRKRSEDGSESVLKNPKHENPTASSTKVQAPKVKLGDKIAVLQQIVSPFGKTDRASVLFEAIQYIKFLQEQVQLLSNPYMKTNTHKDPWGGFDRKDKGDTKPYLRGRGLCLVPISCTPQIYRENAGSDYWSTPAYRGCLYR